MSNTITRIRAFTIWNDEAELKWLEDMASQGYSLIKVRAGFFYTFEQTEPKTVHFCHGFGRVKPADKDEFLQLYSDAGWQHAASHIGWQHYFRSEVENPNVMDKQTAYRKTERLLKRGTVFYLVGGLLLAALLVRFIERDYPTYLFVIYLILVGQYVLMAIWLYGGRKRQLAKLEEMDK